MAQASVDLHFNVQSLALIDSNLDVPVRRAIINHADELYLRHLQKLCSMSSEHLGSQEMLKNVELEMSKEESAGPLDALRHVLLENNRFSTILPRILYESIKSGIKEPNKKRRQTRGVSKPKTHQCPVCPRMFSCAWNMKRHMIHAKHDLKE